ncbi:MAG: InlB B-repeat-containing protein [Spirochaetaceae bacterium]|nr:InlB B-repeat-containing protein [Spirochaetaceae bacterium]
MKLQIVTVLTLVCAAFFAASCVDVSGPLNGWLVAFNANGGVFEENGTGLKVVSCANNQALDILKFPAAKHDTKGLAGWNTKADGSGKDFSSATIVDIDITVYAKWADRTTLEKSLIVSGLTAFDGKYLSAVLSPTQGISGPAATSPVSPALIQKGTAGIQPLYDMADPDNPVPWKGTGAYYVVLFVSAAESMEDIFSNPYIASKEKISFVNAQTQVAYSETGFAESPKAAFITVTGLDDYEGLGAGIMLSKAGEPPSVIGMGNTEIKNGSTGSLALADYDTRALSIGALWAGGNGYNVTVTIIDADGNVIDGFYSTVIFDFSPGNTDVSYSTATFASIIMLPP